MMPKRVAEIDLRSTSLLALERILTDAFLEIRSEILSSLFHAEGKQ